MGTIRPYPFEPLAAIRPTDLPSDRPKTNSLCSAPGGDYQGKVTKPNQPNKPNKSNNYNSQVWWTEPLNVSRTMGSSSRHNIKLAHAQRRLDFPIRIGLVKLPCPVVPFLVFRWLSMSGLLWMKG